MSKKFIFDIGSSINARLAKAAHDGKEHLIIELPEHKECDHGVTFDEVAAKKLLEETPEQKYSDPALAFIMGPANGSAAIRKRWPRLDGHCPKGCGFYGAAYASYAHYIYGDW